MHNEWVREITLLLESFTELKRQEDAEFERLLVSWPMAASTQLTSLLTAIVLVLASNCLYSTYQCLFVFRSLYLLSMSVFLSINRKEALAASKDVRLPSMVSVDSVACLCIV